MLEAYINYKILRLGSSGVGRSESEVNLLYRVTRGLEWGACSPAFWAWERLSLLFLVLPSPHSLCLIHHLCLYTLSYISEWLWGCYTAQTSNSCSLAPASRARIIGKYHCDQPQTLCSILLKEKLIFWVLGMQAPSARPCVFWGNIEPLSTEKSPLIFSEPSNRLILKEPHSKRELCRRKHSFIILLFPREHPWPLNQRRCQQMRWIPWSAGNPTVLELVPSPTALHEPLKEAQCLQRAVGVWFMNPFDFDQGHRVLKLTLASGS